MKPRIRLIIDHAEGHCTEVEIEGPKVTSAMLEAAKDLVQTLTTGERPVFKLLSEDAKVRITAATYGMSAPKIEEASAATYGMSAPKIEEASAHKAASSWNGEESDARKTLRQLAIRLQEEVSDRWELQTSNSFRRVGTSRADGRVLRGTTQRHDGHPDLQGAPDGRVIGSCGDAFPSTARAENSAVGPSAVKKTNAQLGREVDEALRGHHRAGHARKLKPKTHHEIQKTRLATLRARMEDALGDIAWRDTDLYEIRRVRTFAVASVVD